MILRKIRDEEQDIHFKLSSISFVWPYDPKTEEIDDSIIVGAFEDDNKTLMSNVELFEKESTFEGNFVKTVGIGGVATFPQYRRRGTVRELFNEIENMSERENWVFGILFPFSTEYYRQFGYEQVVKSFNITTDLTSLNKIPRNSSATLYEGENTDKLISVYNNFASKYNFMTKRNNSKFFAKAPYKDCKYTYLWADENNNSRAYATYSVGRDEETLIIEELAYDNKESLIGILGFLRNYDGTIKYLNFTNVPAGSLLFEVLSEYSNCKYELKYKASLKIFDFEKMLNLLDYPKEHGCVIVKLNDHMAKNNKTFKIEYENKKVKIEKANDGDADIILSSCAASRLFLSGEKFDVEKIKDINGTKVIGDIDDLLRILPKREANIWDVF